MKVKDFINLISEFDTEKEINLYQYHEKSITNKITLFDIDVNMINEGEDFIDIPLLKTRK